MKYFILVIFLLFPLSSHGQIDNSKYKITSKTVGPFYITTNNDSLEVYFKTDKITYSKELKYDWEESDISFAITDKKNKELYRRNFPSYKGAGSDKFTAEQFTFPYIGKVLLVNFESYPSCGSCGYKGQIFGINSLGYLVPITGTIQMDNGGEKSIDKLKPLWAILQQDKGVVTIGKVKDSKPYIQVITKIIIVD